MMLLSYLRRQTSDVRRQFDFIVVVRYVAWRRVLGIDVRVQMSDVSLTLLWSYATLLGVGYLV